MRTDAILDKLDHELDNGVWYNNVYYEDENDFIDVYEVNVDEVRTALEKVLPRSNVADAVFMSEIIDAIHTHGTRKIADLCRSL